MSKSDLKAAMESLQVRKPLKLQARAPQFQAPTPVTEETGVPVKTQVDPATPVAAQTQVTQETQGAVRTEVDRETPGVPQAQVTAETRVAGGTEVAVETPVSAATQVASETPVLAQPQVSAPTEVGPNTRAPEPTPVPKEPLGSTPPLVHVDPQAPPATGVANADEVTRSVGEQDSSVTMEALAAPKLHNGYTRLPNSFLMRMAAGELARSEMQILLLIARFTISFQRRHAPLSKAVLERQTGLGGPAVLRAIADLVEKGLIEKIPGDQYRPNQLGLAFDDEWDLILPPDRGKSQTPVAAETPVPAQPQVHPATAAPVPPPTPAGVSAGTHFKYTSTIENKDSLSTLPEPLREYFTALRPARKRESEWRAFQEIKAEYSVEDIAASLEHLQTRGIGSGDASQPCHSPMTFLAKAMDSVLPEVIDRRERVQDRRERQKAEAREQELKAQEEAREAEEWRNRLDAFSNAYPTKVEQENVIARFLTDLPFRPDTHAGRVLAINRWAETLRNGSHET